MTQPRAGGLNRSGFSWERRCADRSWTRMIKDVLRLELHGGLSHEAVVRSLSVFKGIAATYVLLATPAH